MLIGSNILDQGGVNIVVRVVVRRVGIINHSGVRVNVIAVGGWRRIYIIYRQHAG